MPPTIEQLKEADELLRLLDEQGIKPPQGDLEADLKAAQIRAAQKRIAEVSAFLENAQQQHKLLRLPYEPEEAQDDWKLRRYNTIRRKYGLDDVGELPPKVGIAEEFDEQLEPENIPLAGGFITAKELWDVSSSAKRVEEGEASLEDWERLAVYMDQAAKDAQERTFGGAVARIALGSIPFWIDFFVSGGIPAVLKTGGKAVAKKGIKRQLSKVLTDAAAKVAKIAGTTALRLPTFSHRVAAGTVQRMLPQFATMMPADADADVEFVVLEKGEGALEATKNALGDVYIEVFSEQTGEILALIGGPLRKAFGLKPGRIGAREFLRQFGFHGVAGEMLEERIGEALRETATRMAVLDLPQQAPSATQLAQEAIAFAIPSGGAAVAQKGIKHRPTLERAQAFAMLHPEASARIAALEGKPSRKQLKEAAGETLTNEEVGRMNRSAFRDILRDTLELQAKPAEVAPTAKAEVGREQPPVPEAPRPQPPVAEAPAPQPVATAADQLEGPDFRSSYVFQGTKAGQAMAEELRGMLPPGLRSKVKVVKKGHKLYNTADGEEVASKIGLEKMGRSILLKQTGKPDLAIPAEGDLGRRLVRASDEADLLAGVPEKRRDEVVKQEAAVRLEKDYAGEKAQLLEIGRTGGQLRDTDTAVAKKIFTQEALPAALSGNLDAVLPYIRLASAWRRTGTEQARGLRQRFDPQEKPIERRRRAITEALLTPAAQAEAQINKFLEEGKVGEAEKLQAEWARTYGEIVKALENVGIDLNDIDEILADDVATARLLGTIHAYKGGGFDAIFEYWRNSILSAPTTQLANIIGNTTFSAWYFTAERLVEGIVNTVARNPKNVQWGEFKYLAAGILPGLSNGARNFFRAWDSETPYFELSLRQIGATKIEEPHIAITGEKGRIIRAHQRTLLAFDELYKTLFANMEVGAQAYRIAKADGLRGPQLQERVARLVQDTNSPAWDEALTVARKLAFQSRENQALQVVLDLRRKVPGARYLVPFVTTPWNIFGEGIRRSPLGVVNLAHDAYRASKDGSWNKVVSQFSNQLIAWAAVLCLMDNDPEEPWITGAAVQSKYSTRQQAYRTFQPQSIKIGDTWYSYARIEPMATWLSLAVDVADALKSDAPLEAIVKPFDNLAGQLQTKTMMQGIGDIVEATQRGFDVDAFGRWASSFTVSWIPNLVRRVGEERHEFVPERGVWGETPDKMHRWIRRVVQKTGLGFVPDEPKIDLWGRPARRGLERRPQTDFWWRVLLPIRRHTEDVAIGDRIIINWNSQHPLDHDQYNPSQPRPYYTQAGKRTWFNDQEYRQFLELSGRLANMHVQRLAGSFDIEKPTEADIKRLEKILEARRIQARGRLRVEWQRNPMADRDPNLVNRLFEQLAGMP